MRWPKSSAARVSSSMHRTVLLQETIDALDLQPGEVAIDGTLGAGGHSEEIVRRFGQRVAIHAFDLDADAIERAKARLAPLSPAITYHLANFRDMAKELAGEKVDGIALDLGYSSDQLESSGRGLSFLRDEPLRMTLKKEISEAEFDAADIVNRWDEEDIANIIYGYGEERFARRIAREIVEAREHAPIDTTARLVEVVEHAVPSFYKRGRIHPATKTFQALRIAVNDELESLRAALVAGWDILKPGGRFAVITFHSLEDRIVKHTFRDWAKAEEGTLITKKPITPSTEELRENPRARSAQLRIIEKL